MIERTQSLCFRSAPFPIFPNGRCSVFRHSKPARALFVFEQLVGIFYVQIGKHFKYKRRGQKSRAEPPAVIFHCLDKPRFSVFFLLFRQKSHIKRTDEFCLSVGIKCKSLFSNEFLICPLCTVAVFLDFLQASCLSAFRELRQFPERALT